MMQAVMIIVFIAVCVGIAAKKKSVARIAVVEPANNEE
jgi:hypothetical protein